MSERLPTTSTLRRRWADADAAARRDLIIRVAMGLLQRHGPRAMTVRRVAQRLGVGAMTLYTYVRGQHELRRHITRRGFEMLRGYCQSHTTLGTARGWRGGAAAYVRFARENPNLYELMFTLPYRFTNADKTILQGGFDNLLERVRERFRAKGLRGAKLQREALAAAGRFWVALHGLASLAIAGRLEILGRSLDHILDDLLPRVQPDDGRG